MRTRFVRFQGMGNQVPSGSWWMVMAPGLMLISFGIAILVWPELLAYLVAFIVLSIGITVTGWGWRLRQVANRQMNHSGQKQQVQYDNSDSLNIFGSATDESKASNTTIYYER